MVGLIFIFGLTIGSFLNVLIDRIPRTESIIKGRSHCEKCKKALGWYDLIPVISFILLRQKCRHCKSPISFYYPIIEVITGVLFIFTYLTFFERFIIYDLRFMISFIYYLFIISSLIVIFFTDLKYGIIPDKVIYPSILVSFLFQIFTNYQLLITYLLSAIGAFLFFLFIFLLTKGKAMGFGDVKFSFLIGMVLGFPNIIFSIYMAFLTGAFVSLILIICRKKHVKETIPFGPFLVFSMILFMFLGEKITGFFLAVLHL